MADENLTGKRVLAVVSNYGVEQDELFVPVRELLAAGAEVDVAAVSSGIVQTLVGDKDPGESLTPALTVAQADHSNYDLLLLPGGTLNADALRLDDDAVELVRAFTSAGSTVAAICHGPWALVEAAVVKGKRLTSYPSLATDIRNAGGDWVDEEAATDSSGGWTLITSRTPDDLDAFVREMRTALVTATD
ncbi:type 1 glutamine amidotransferase domain-containing protein [Streptomyces sp. NPDC048172]|uniref:type 1 glutamine amidotransferase domain-containing protein n=1 Tax=Streptomyces sp. NPDC048172 TaxID=3365505 RepID=UPI003719D07D